MVNQFQKEYESELKSRRDNQAVIGGALAAVIFFFYIVVSFKVFSLGDQMMGYLLIVFPITWFIWLAFFMLYNYLWKQNLLPWSKRVIIQILITDFRNRKSRIDAEILHLLNSNYIKHSKIPEKFLEVQNVLTLENYLKQKKVQTLDEAIKLLEIQMNADFQSSLLEEDNLIEEARRVKDTDFIYTVTTKKL